MAPAFGLPVLAEGAAAVRREWAAGGRAGNPRVVAERYFCLGPGADEARDHYLAHYYGDEYLPEVRPDAPTTERALREELARVEAAGCDDLVLLPCSGELDQVERLAAAL